MGRCVRRGGCWRRCQEAQGPRQRTQLSPWTRPGPGCQACAASWRRPAPPSASSDGQTSSVLRAQPFLLLVALARTQLFRSLFPVDFFSVFSRLLLICVGICSTTGLRRHLLSDKFLEITDAAQKLKSKCWCRALGGGSEIHLKVWGTRLFQRKTPNSKFFKYEVASLFQRKT